MGMTVNRGQTNIDFIIAIAVFLIAFTFVLGFMPRLFAPYADEEKPLVANRVASTLVDSLLAESENAGVLDTTCTAGFFNGTDGDCSFDSSNTRVEQVRISNAYHLNMTVRRNVTGDSTPDILCFDTSTGDIGECQGGEKLAAGPSSPENQRSVASARRAALLDGESTIVDVKVW